MTQLNDGATDLTKGLTNYTAGVSQLNSGASQLADNNDKLQSGVTSLSGGVDQVKSGSDQLLVGLNQLSTLLKESTEDKETKDNLDTLMTSLPIINDGIQDLNAALGGQAGGLNTDSITEDLTNVGTNLNGMKENFETTKTNYR